MVKNPLVVFLLLASFIFTPGFSYAEDGGESLLQKVRSKLPEIHGFAETAYGPRIGDHRTRHHSFNLLEQRFQLKTTFYPSFSKILEDWYTEIQYKGEMLVDEYQGKVSYDTRELFVSASPTSFMDVKIGRQILTWGTGDLIFINDVFPKDFVSFFIGRDDEYLKVPSDGVKVSLSSKWASLDMVAIPWFQPDTPILGNRLSFYDTTLGRVSGSDSDRFLEEPAWQLSNTGVAGRLHGTVKGVEWAAYGYRGYYNQPRGVDTSRPATLYYPRLNVLGSSLRGNVPFVGGLGNTEFGFYDSVESHSGKNPMVQPSSVRYLAGYERDMGNDFRVGFQYYVEQFLNFETFNRNLPPNATPQRQFKQLATVRLTKSLFMQTLELSFFAFYGITDRDAHLRPRVTWKINDNWKATGGADIFFGQYDYTQFGQLEGNQNIYFRLRYSF